MTDAEKCLMKSDFYDKLVSTIDDDNNLYLKQMKQNIINSLKIAFNEGVKYGQENNRWIPKKEI